MILELLKEKTSLNHRKLEQSALLAPISQKSMDRVTYQAILEKFYGYFRPLEERIGAFETIEQYLPDYAERRHAKLLLQDWQALQESVTARVSTGFGAGFSISEPILELDPETSELELCTDLPVVVTTAEAFGCLYVMEGSTLGGRFIAKVVHDCLGFTAERGARFFHGYGEQTGAKWKSFGKALVSFCAQHGQEEQMVAAANQTFEKMERWLNR